MSEKTITIPTSEYQKIQAILDEFSVLSTATKEIIAASAKRDKKIREELATDQAEVEHAKRILNL